ncbi:hypothetical protein Mmc1_2499 [Magnetococcus marinus MC-1]|uniref:Uncharacterized protein n=1 Tax=Magnetococcus marinus (strain ATCC BAA-1437 / JCM 17883 / MC-1) TaxID=156889 RepID=A0LAK6_MAGMM|nr:hypothetical protein Mmc1_2499 [Magnetococcus marinus MC-1]
MAWMACIKRLGPLHKGGLGWLLAINVNLVCKISKTWKDGFHVCGKKFLIFIKYNKMGCFFIGIAIALLASTSSPPWCVAWIVTLLRREP